MTENVKHTGVSYYLNGRYYIIPGLTLAHAEEFETQLVEVSDLDLHQPKAMFRLIALYLPMIGAAFRRNYPDVTDANLKEWIDLGMQFGEIVQIIRAGTGFTRVISEGEQQPAALTGDTSTAH